MAIPTGVAIVFCSNALLSGACLTDFRHGST